jgi:hypothetical protein
MDEKKKKNSSGFTILKNDSTDGHGGYGVGTISLNNVTPVIIDPNEEESFIDMGALHARSKVEKGVKWIPNREEVPNGKQYWIVWVTVERLEQGPCYVGLGACELVIDYNIRRGYKSMPEHVNNMDKSMKRKVVVDHMDEKSKQLLEKFLQEYDLGMWERSSQELKKPFA